METKDIYIKDEGESITICFQTPKAIKSIRKQGEPIKSQLYGDKTYLKLDIPATKKNIKDIKLFAKTYNLTVESEINL